MRETNHSSNTEVQTQAEAVEDNPPRFDEVSKMEMGDAAFFNGEDTEALRHYSRAMIEQAGDVEPWIAQIRILILSGRDLEAQTWIKRALESLHESPALRAFNCVVLARVGRRDEALTASERLAKQNPNDLTVLLCRAQVLLTAKRRGAHRCFRKALQISPESDWRTPFYIAMICECEVLWRKAARYYDALIRRNNRLAYAWYRKARLHAQLKQNRAARHALTNAQLLCNLENNQRLLAKVRKVELRSLVGWLKELLRRN